MSFGWVSAGVAVGSALLGASEGRKAASQASDANAKALASQESATADRLAFDKQVYDDGADDRKWASENARQMSKWQAEDRTKYNALQDEQIARGRKYQGAEDQILADAQTFDSEAKREELAGKAMADVEQGFASAEGSAQRNQQRMGVNPSSGRAQALSKQGIYSKALGLAGAATKARSDATTQGYARKMDAVGLGKGIIGNQATQASLQLGAGNSSVGNSTMPINIRQSAGGIMSGAYGNAAAGYQNLGKTQANSFYDAQKYGAGVGQNVAAFAGKVLGGFTGGFGGASLGGSGNGSGGGAGFGVNPGPGASFDINDF